MISTRIAPGHHARLIDVSDGGALVDTPARLLPGSSVEMRLATRGRQIAIRGEIVRCAVARLGPVVYRGAVRFDQRLRMFADGLDPEQALPAREDTTHDIV